MAGVTYTAAEMIGKLVAFNTTSHRSNLDLIQFCTDYLASHGVEAVLIHNPDGTKADLVATIGPSVAGGVLLSGHTDAVPVAGQDWESDPYEVMERDGRLHGRGPCSSHPRPGCSRGPGWRWLSADLAIPTKRTAPTNT
ncbi:MAG: M20/M25/M40 family metallo-hydrolase [Rhodospirillales bacterium]|jgi:acetylornithine deacetylase|nr:M20/M25/M40 family metallo-hydrolase [Rhodospirillales bacterium]HJO72203.1 M20/M25/M40 family metallo-hydrolase [Rhodospirillales bacterium]